MASVIRTELLTEPQNGSDRFQLLTPAAAADRRSSSWPSAEPPGHPQICSCDPQTPLHPTEVYMATAPKHARIPLPGHPEKL